METEKPFVQHLELTSDKFAERKEPIQEDRLATVATIPDSWARFESINPSGYRLVRKRNGEMVLQGAFHWQQGFSTSGFEWRDIPTVDVDD